MQKSTWPCSTLPSSNTMCIEPHTGFSRKYAAKRATSSGVMVARSVGIGVPHSVDFVSQRSYERYFCLVERHPRRVDERTPVLYQHTGTLRPVTSHELAED